jgi:hypothetical protein
MWIQRGGRDRLHCIQLKNRGREEDKVSSPDKGEGGALPRELLARADQPTTTAGDDRRKPPRARTDREQQVEKKSLGAIRAGKFFLKNQLWAHRTVYSVCPVHTGQRTVAVRWTTGQGSTERDLRTQPVHRTLHSAVSDAQRTVLWAQIEGFMKFSRKIWTKPTPNL